MDLWIATAPAVMLILLFVHLDRKRPEPAREVLWVVCLGALICLPAALVEWLEAAALGTTVISAQGRLVEAFVVAALTEEVLKLSVVRLYLWRKPHFDEVMDGILYTAAVSLGFALVENVLYTLGNPRLGLLRSVTAVPLHAVASGIMGYFVGRARMAQQRVGLWLACGLALSVAIHGFYDWTVLSGAGFGIAPPDAVRGFAWVLPLVLACAVVLQRLVSHALSLDDFWLGPNSRRRMPAPVVRASDDLSAVMVPSSVRCGRPTAVANANIGPES